MKIVNYYYMALQSTTLARIITRMQRWQSIVKEEEQYLVEDIDSAIYNRTRNFMLPWLMKKSSIRVFRDVFEYPVESDYIGMGLLDGTQENFGDRPRPYYTSLTEFLQDPNGRSTIAEIWEDGSVRYGIRNKKIEAGAQTLNTADSTTGWSASGTASNIALETVNVKEGQYSISFDVTAGTATVQNTIANGTPDSEYKRKYQFKWIYLSTVPTSISLRAMVDASNYLQTTGITTQFSGAALKANAWNLVAQDLNTATVVGSVGTSPTFTLEEFDLVGATAGRYYADASYLRAWELMDNWYYGANMVKTLSSAIADQPTFKDSDGIYSSDSSIVCDDRFVDCIMYEALIMSATERENEKLISLFVARANQAWEDVKARYPSIEPYMITHKWRFPSHEGKLAQPYYRGV